MNEHRVEGTARNLGGKAQEGLGRATGNAKTRAEGLLNETAGAAQHLYGQAQDAAANTADAVRQGAESTEDYVRSFVETRPYAAVIGAFFAGWAIAYLGRRH